MGRVVCMATDFFYPNVGGVEEHVLNLSACLIALGYKVIAVTHSYGGRVGVRYMTRGLKVYYLPIRVFYNECVLPTMVCSVGVVRDVLVRERVDIVHAHSAFSALGHEVSLVARLMGLKTVFTDHSLFGFADASAVLTNKFLELSLADCDHCVCVSHTGKENTVLRARVPHERVSVIPNAVDARRFAPDPSRRDPARITVVIVSRLVYRKGVDLMAGLIARACRLYADVEFVVGGDGPKSWLLQEVREREGLQDRVELLGALEHSQVRSALTRGHIFVNASLTEAFCMAIVEAAACGLQVVSTSVGGVPEVLPSDMIYLAEPTVDGLVAALERAIRDLRAGRNLCPFECNRRVRRMYNWEAVTRRTVVVYDRVAREPPKTLGQRLLRYLPCGVWPFLLVVSLVYLMIRFLEWARDRRSIDVAKDMTGARAKKRRNENS